MLFISENQLDLNLDALGDAYKTLDPSRQFGVMELIDRWFKNMTNEGWRYIGMSKIKGFMFHVFEKQPT